MAKAPSRRRSKKRRPGFFQKNKILLIILALAGLSVASLVFLARIEEQPPPPVVKPVSPPVKKPPVDYSVRVHEEIEAFLAGRDLEPPGIERDLEHRPARYTVKAEFPTEEAISDFRRRLAVLPGQHTVRFREANSLTIERQRQTRVIIHFIPPVRIEELPSGPMVTIIMDDLGRSVRTAEALIRLPGPITFSILPGEDQAVKVAEMAHAAGLEVMLHVPMEPQGYPAVNPGSDALFVSYSQTEIRRRFDEFLEKLPYVTGSNNHMGSRFTEDAKALAPVMESLREKGLFFVDSRTTGLSKAFSVAERYGVPAMKRDTFLDNLAEVDAIAVEIRRLEKKARRQGMAIGICHPYPQTLEALRRELPGLIERGTTIVPVSALLRKKAMTQGS